MRDPVQFTLLVAEFAASLAGPQVRRRSWTPARDRRRRALFVSSAIGLGHALRDVAIADALRALHPDLQIDWLAQHPVTQVLADRGERVHPASRFLASESAHVEAEAGEHDLHAFQAIRFMLAHRPGFVSPTLAARQFASLDQFSGGRLGVHYISGGSDDEQKRDGDWLDHDQRYARTDEYLEVLRKVWTADQPFDHEGAHYRFKDAFSEVKPVQTRNGRPHVPVYFGGASEAAIPVAGKHADVYALWGESLDQARELTGRVRAEAARHGRSVRFSVSFRPILAETEAKAWERADSILAETRRLRVVQGFGRGGPLQSEGARRLLAAAEQGDAARQAAVDRGRTGDRRPLEQHGAGRHPGAGRRCAARLPRARRDHLPDPRLRPARGRDRLRPRTDPAHARAGGAARAAQRQAA